MPHPEDAERREAIHRLSDLYAQAIVQHDGEIVTDDHGDTITYLTDEQADEIARLDALLHGTTSDEPLPSLDRDDVVVMECLRNEAGRISIRKLAERHTRRLQNVRATGRRRLSEITDKLIEAGLADREPGPNRGPVGLNDRGRRVLERLFQ